MDLLGGDSLTDIAAELNEQRSSPSYAKRSGSDSPVSTHTHAHTHLHTHSRHLELAAALRIRRIVVALLHIALTIVTVSSWLGVASPEASQRMLGAMLVQLVCVLTLTLTLLLAPAHTFARLINTVIALVFVVCAGYPTWAALAAGVRLDERTITLLLVYVYVYPLTLALPFILHLGALACIAPTFIAAVLVGAHVPKAAGDAVPATTSVTGDAQAARASGVYTALTVCVYMVMTALPQWFAYARQHQQRAALALLGAEARAQKVLLRRVIPEVYLEALENERSRMTSKPIPDVSVIFCEVMTIHVDPSTGERKPRKLGYNVQQNTLTVLAYVFKILDRVVMRNGVMKVETIGSEFMAVSGLPHMLPHHPNSAYAALITALDMMRAVAREARRGRLGILAGGMEIGLQIGINSGPVVESILGRKMLPRWKLFGDTVNTASRMKSNGTYGRIHVSRATRNLLMRDAAWIITRARQGHRPVHATQLVDARVPLVRSHSSEPGPPPSDTLPGAGPQLFTPRSGQRVAALPLSPNTPAITPASMGPLAGLLSPGPVLAKGFAFNMVQSSPIMTAQGAAAEHRLAATDAVEASTWPQMSDDIQKYFYTKDNVEELLPSLWNFIEAAQHGAPLPPLGPDAPAAAVTVGVSQDPGAADVATHASAIIGNQILGDVSVPITDADIMFARAVGWFLRPRAPIQVKGKGIMHTYFVEVNACDAPSREQLRVMNRLHSSGLWRMPAGRTVVPSAAGTHGGTDAGDVFDADGVLLPHMVDDISLMSADSQAWLRAHDSAGWTRQNQTLALEYGTRRRPRRWSGRGFPSRAGPLANENAGASRPALAPAADSSAVVGVPLPAGLGLPLATTASHPLPQSTVTEHGSAVMLAVFEPNTIPATSVIGHGVLAVAHLMPDSRQHAEPVHPVSSAALGEARAPPDPAHDLPALSAAPSLAGSSNKSVHIRSFRLEPSAVPVTNKSYGAMGDAVTIAVSASIVRAAQGSPALSPSPHGEGLGSGHPSVREIHDPDDLDATLGPAQARGGSSARALAPSTPTSGPVRAPLAATEDDDELEQDPANAVPLASILLKRLRSDREGMLRSRSPVSAALTRRLSSKAIAPRGQHPPGPMSRVGSRLNMLRADLAHGNGGALPTEIASERRRPPSGSRTPTAGKQPHASPLSLSRELVSRPVVEPALSPARMRSHSTRLPGQLSGMPADGASKISRLPLATASSRERHDSAWSHEVHKRGHRLDARASPHAELTFATAHSDEENHSVHALHVSDLSALGTPALAGRSHPRRSDVSVDFLRASPHHHSGMSPLARMAHSHLPPPRPVSGKGPGPDLPPLFIRRPLQSEGLSHSTATPASSPAQAQTAQLHPFQDPADAPEHAATALAQTLQHGTVPRPAGHLPVGSIESASMASPMVMMLVAESGARHGHGAERATTLDGEAAGPATASKRRQMMVRGGARRASMELSAMPRLLVPVPSERQPTVGQGDNATDAIASATPSPRILEDAAALPLSSGAGAPSLTPDIADGVGASTPAAGDSPVDVDEDRPLGCDYVLSYIVPYMLPEEALVEPEVHPATLRFVNEQEKLETLFSLSCIVRYSGVNVASLVAVSMYFVGCTAVVPRLSAEAGWATVGLATVCIATFSGAVWLSHRPARAALAACHELRAPADALLRCARLVRAYNVLMMFTLMASVASSGVLFKAIARGDAIPLWQLSSAQRHDPSPSWTVSAWYNSHAMYAFIVFLLTFIIPHYTGLVFALSVWPTVISTLVAIALLISEADTGDAVTPIIAIVCVVIVSMASAAVQEIRLRSAFLDEELAHEQQAKTRRMLYAMLPPVIVDAMLAREGVRAAAKAARFKQQPTGAFGSAEDLVAVSSSEDANLDDVHALVHGLHTETFRLIRSFAAAIGLRVRPAGASDEAAASSLQSAAIAPRTAGARDDLTGSPRDVLGLLSADPQTGASNPRTGMPDKQAFAGLAPAPRSVVGGYHPPGTAKGHARRVLSTGRVASNGRLAAASASQESPQRSRLLATLSTYDEMELSDTSTEDSHSPVRLGKLSSPLLLAQDAGQDLTQEAQVAVPTPSGWVGQHSQSAASDGSVEPGGPSGLARPSTPPRVQRVARISKQTSPSQLRGSGRGIDSPSRAGIGTLLHSVTRRMTRGQTPDRGDGTDGASTHLPAAHEREQPHVDGTAAAAGARYTDLEAGLMAAHEDAITAHPQGERGMSSSLNRGIRRAKTVTEAARVVVSAARADPAPLAAIGRRLSLLYRRAAQHDVALLMFDLVGFTSMSAAVGPHRVVELLDRLYASFDRVVAKRGALKVETIGDAMLVACGVPTPMPLAASARTIAKCALDMIRIVNAFSSQYRNSLLHGHTLQARIGVHVGTVLAGVIGDQMPRYQLFGPAVDEAQAMESSSEPGQVHASAEFVKVLEMQIPLAKAIEYDSSRQAAVAMKRDNPGLARWLLGISPQVAAANVAADDASIAESTSQAPVLKPSGRRIIPLADVAAAATARQRSAAAAESPARRLLMSMRGQRPSAAQQLVRAAPDIKVAQTLPDGSAFLTRDRTAALMGIPW